MWTLAVARFFTFLALSLWIGGLAFFGAMAAPAMFKVARAADRAEIAPQMVALMLSRFGFVAYACCALLVLGWIIEKWSGAVSDRTERIWWWLQGAATLTMLLIIGTLNGVLMPQIQAMQTRVLANDPSVKAAFDAAHQNYSRLAAIALYAALFILFVFAWRTSRSDAKA